jgi:hypothetical protein
MNAAGCIALSNLAVRIDYPASQVAVFAASPDRGLRVRLEMNRRRLIEEETRVGFDPAHNDADFDRLAKLLDAK